ncbi:MAG: hypothetical protein ABL889_11365 [Terricaulis sp.]
MVRSDAFKPVVARSISTMAPRSTPGEAAQIFGTRHARGPESAVDAFHADQLRSACVFAQPLKANQAPGDALARMRRFQFTRAFGFKRALLLRQQSGGGALTVAPVAEADEFLLKLGIEPPHARASRFSQAQFF